MTIEMADDHGIVRPSKACTRCHARKVKCDGKENCGNCVEAGLPCERRIRLSRLQGIRTAEQRTKWLEDEISLLLNFNCRQIPTGTPLSAYSNNYIGASLAEASRNEISDSEFVTASPNTISQTRHIDASSETTQDSQFIQSSDIGLLALNATGEPRFLGPSSGSTFLNLASSHARSFLNEPPAFSRGIHKDPNVGRSPREIDRLLTPTFCNGMLQSFLTWVHIIHPLFDPEYLDILIKEQLVKLRAPSDALEAETSQEKLESCIFFLVMALGAVTAHYGSRLNVIGDNAHGNSSSTNPSPNELYNKALELLELVKKPHSASLPLIQAMILASIYGSYQPAGASQWQLAGLTIRLCIELGLHYKSARSNQEIQNLQLQQRAFWTAYAVEVSVSFNMGRPPSITEEHITTDLPIANPDTVMAIHHIRHRRIQDKIISRVFRTAGSIDDGLNPPAEATLQQLQVALDEWKEALPELYKQSSSEYPVEYWERFYYSTTCVLHRSSPLCPTPSFSSAETCIRAAGAFIESVHSILKGHEIPLSWMIAQGVLFTGLTMLITARLNTMKLIQQVGPPILVVNISNWSLKCSVCLAILKERLKEELLAKLEAEYETFSNDTIKYFWGALSETSDIFSSRATRTLTGLHTPATLGMDIRVESEECGAGQTSSASTAEIVVGGSTQPFDSFTDTAMTWESLQPFSGLFSEGPLDGFWELFPQLHQTEIFGDCYQSAM